jgi:hypothetical protein
MAIRGKIWNTKKINEQVDLIERGLTADYSPFYEGKIELKGADVVFEYTKEELEELARCASDVVYFGNNYCYSMTDEGVRQITLRPYQEEMLTAFQENRFVVMLASRQIGKCHLYDTKIDLKDKDGTVKKVSIGNLYYKVLSTERPLTFLEKLKRFLWNFYDKLMRKFLKYIIVSLIEFIERYEYRNASLDQDDPTKKILNTIGCDYLVNTDTGWQPLSHVHITQPFRVWMMTTASGKKLECADNHKVFTLDKQEIFVKDVKPGTLVCTEDGYESVVSVKQGRNSVSMFDATVDSKDHRYYTNGILSHNTVTSSIFIAWYLCFHADRNIMVVANKLATTSEIVDKIKTILKNLPFFIKPGIVQGGVTGMKFDNGCRLFSQATTKTAAIGFTIHLLFADEFAHIHANFLLPFYRSIYPTLSSSKVSRMITCSTPNGMNLFYEIYQGAIERKNNYFPIRVDWWQVPGRNEEWKQREIANLGGEELFNQEYGNQFLSSSRLLFDSYTLKLMSRTTVEFLCKETDTFLDYPDLNNQLKWIPSFDPGDESVKDYKMILSVDIGDGVGRDYSVINMFQLVPQSIPSIKKTRDWMDETSFFRLKQVGLFRSNVHSVEELAKALELLVFDLFHPENCKVVLEINFKGNIVHEKIARHKEFFPEIFLYTKHSMSNDTLKLGVKLQKDNRETYCRELRNLVKNKKIVTYDKRTFEELSSFGINNVGRYESQIGNDDVAMSCVNLVSLFESIDFYEMVEDIYDTSAEIYKSVIDKRMASGDHVENDLMSTYRLFDEFEKDRKPKTQKKFYRFS